MAILLMQEYDFEGPSPSQGAVEMGNIMKSNQQRRPYKKPSITRVTENELLELLGPAQGYGQTAMPLDSEWVRRS